MAVRTPIIGGKFDAPAMPKQSGSAINDTRNPESKSDFQYCLSDCMIEFEDFKEVEFMGTLNVIPNGNELKMQVIDRNVNLLNVYKAVK
jgi:hypothetical protein